MNPVVHSENHRLIVYDADRIPEPDAALFDPASWERKGAVSGQARGRGNALFLETGFGPAVLRWYKRGGLPAKFSENRYLYMGIQATRPFREFHLLRQMTELGLPVPGPLAVLIENAFFTYRGALLMERIENVKPLADYLGFQADDSTIWSSTGACIRRFHEAGVSHADLNARNILINSALDKIYLVDFDRCSLSPGRIVDGVANLARLKRSLEKLWPHESGVKMEACWQALSGGYYD